MDLTVRAEITKFLKENTGVNFVNLNQVASSDMTTKAQVSKEKIDFSKV